MVKLDCDGEVEWTTSTFMSVEGSFSSTVQIKSSGGDGYGCATHLVLSGNPSKFLQGHNIFGSDDLIQLVYRTALRVFDLVGLKPSIAELGDLKNGHYDITRLDITYSWRLRSRADVRAWLRAAEFKSRTRTGRPVMTGTTLYFGKHSRRWAIKAYSKGDEIDVKGRQLPDELQGLGLIEYADPLLRIELTLRGKELKETNEQQAAKLTPAVCRKKHAEYLERIEMSAQIAIPQAEFENIPHRLAGTYELWKSGHDLRSLLPKATFYRHRSQLLEYGVDITFARETTDVSNVVPLIRFVEAEPEPVPDWAFTRRLIAI